MQTIDTGADGYTMGNLTIRHNSKMTDAEKKRIGVPEYAFPPGEMTVLIRTEGDDTEVFSLGLQLNVATIVPISWKPTLACVKLIIQYLILTLYEKVPPSTANLMEFKVLLYLGKPYNMVGFGYVSQTHETRLCTALPGVDGGYEYFTTLMFDEAYNTQYVRAPRLDLVPKPSWTVYKGTTPPWRQAKPQRPWAAEPPHNDPLILNNYPRTE